jgi:hypothetical protein
VSAPRPAGKSTANAFYMTVLSALLGVLALGEASRLLSGSHLGLVMAVSTLAVVLCWIWRKTVDFYGAMFSIKFDVPRLLGNDATVPGLLALLFAVLMLLTVGLGFTHP